MGASAEVGESSGVFADEHDASVTSVTTRATTSRHARKITGRPYVRYLNQNRPRPIAAHSLEMARALAPHGGLEQAQPLPVPPQPRGGGGGSADLRG